MYGRAASFLLCAVVTLFCSSTNGLQLHLGNETDQASLLAFKAQLESGGGSSSMVLSSWNQSFHFCQWQGITCDRHHRRVTSLNLQRSGLKGSISPHIGNLSFLRRIGLQENQLDGLLPQELGRLTVLEALNMSHNLLQGEVPANLSYCSKLTYIDLSNNQLVGEFPVELTTLPLLLDLRFTWNNMTGTISPSLANLSNLENLSFGSNNLVEGIPSNLGRLQRLKGLEFAFNRLTGTIPLSIYNISSLKALSMSGNRLMGSLPQDLGLLLPKLQKLLLSGNQFTGALPPTLVNASELYSIYLGTNSFSGRLPSNLGRLRRLQILQLNINHLQEDDEELSTISSLTNCTELRQIGLRGNNLSAHLPESLSNLSTRLTWLGLGENNLYGNIPAGIGNLAALEFLVLQINFLTGEIPSSIWTLPRLEELGLAENRLTGKIPPHICNNSQLSFLGLGRNSMEGNIPTAIGQCDKLQTIGLEANKFSGPIPKEIFSIPSLSLYLGFSFNFLSGPLPSEIGNLRSLDTLVANNNNFSGEIPSSLGSCQSLRRLYLGSNNFHGVIPSSLNSLKFLELLDLSQNNLSGPIPPFFESFKSLGLLNLSFNNFEGEVPMGGIFLNSSAISLDGNNKICGGPPNLGLNACPSIKDGRKKRSAHLVVIIPVVSSIVVLLGIVTVALVVWLKRPRRRMPSSKYVSDGKLWKVTYQDLVQATKGFSNECLIGAGKYGSVYKATFEEGNTVVAVKVLNFLVRGSSSAFAAECKTLRKIRHRNLVKVLTTCESMDYQGNSFKALLFQYMSNGSLDQWLHSGNENTNQAMKNLNATERLNIAIDVAEALDYLHNRWDKPIVHCDLKPSNILLDDDMVAHVADFGLAKILHDSSSSFILDQSFSVPVKGTVAYIPPGDV